MEVSGSKLERADAIDRLIATPGLVYLMGGLDTGKTTFAMDLIQRAGAAGVPAAIVDADIVQSSIGPPTTVGLKLCSGLEDLSPTTLRAADGLAFVGALVPKGHLLPIVTGTAKLVARAADAGCRLIVVDSTSLISGIYGQTLKYFKIDLISPDFIVAFERGGEMEPLVGLASRFSPGEVFTIDAIDVPTRTAEERVAWREAQFAAYFEAGTSRWRVKPTVFMPTLPPEFDHALLDGLVVGMEDGKGRCVGIGILEYDSAEDVLRMISPVNEGVRGLRLGSTRMEVNGRSRGPVDLRHLFGSE